MKNTKEFQPILTAIYCINEATNKDKDIQSIISYAFKSIFGCTTNMLSLCCLGKTRETILVEIEDMLKKETNYK